MTTVTISFPAEINLDIPVGEQGPPGRDGTDGTDGIDGTDGVKGDKGDQGIQGIQGPPRTGGGGGAGLGVNALDFPGADLGAKINAAFAAGHLDIFVPYAPNLVIRTTVQLRHACTVEFSPRYPQHILCATNDLPVFECVGSLRHWRIVRGIFDGSPIDTPSCFLLMARPEGASQNGDTTPMADVQCTGCWGMGCVVAIACEIVNFPRCHLWSTSGKGDSTWTGPRATVVYANRDYWNVPFAYTKPRVNPGSTSAISFPDCDLRAGTGGSVFLLKGQVEDISIQPMYLNATGRCSILVEAGETGGVWGCPRRVTIRGGGRSENNGASANCPLVIVDGFNIGGMGLYHLSVDNFGVFMNAGLEAPVFKTERGGQFYALHLGLNVHLENCPWLIDHRQADMNWADIRSSFNTRIDVTGRAVNHCDIKIGGNFLGTNGTRNMIRAANWADWTL